MIDQSGCRAVCCREYQASINQSVHSLLKRKISDINLNGFEILDAKIKHQNGGDIYYQGLARDPQAIKSIDNAQLAWVEEAQTLSSNSLEELTPSIRGKDSEIWFTANLQSSNDPFAERFFVPFEKELRNKGYYEDDLHTIVWINYYDNPWFPKYLDDERIADKRRMSTAGYDHKWLGEPSDTVDNAIILPEWFDAAIDSHIKLGFKPRGARIVSHDPSDHGDAKGLVDRHGSVILNVLENDYDDVNDGCDWATDYAVRNKADLFTWDADGLGVTLRRQVRDALEGKRIDYRMFKGSERVDRPEDIYEPIEDEERFRGRTNKQVFKNKRAQRVWQLRDRYFNTYMAVTKKDEKYRDPDTLISLSSSITCLQQLRSETCRVPLKPNGNGLIQIMDKRDMMSRYGMKSPNLFDSTFMSLEVPNVMQKPQENIYIPKLKRL